MYNNLRFERKERIGILRINRPEALNALNGDVIAELEQIVEEIEKEDTLRALILTGEGRSFVAGADIAAQSVLDLEGGLKWGRRGSALFRKIELLPIPVIAAVNGFALGGGCELALACDIIVASENAKFGQPEVSLGITPGFSGTQRLPRRVGIAMAKELIYTGKIIKADEAKAIGLVNKVVPPEELIKESMELAERIVKNAPIAVKYAKYAMNEGIELGLDAAIAVENHLFAMCFATEDQKEGMKAFLEKRQAEFKNK